MNDIAGATPAPPAVTASPPATANIGALEERLRGMHPEDGRGPVLKAHLDYLTGKEGAAISDFRHYLDSARLRIVADRGLWKEVCQAAFAMREFAAYESLLLFQFHLPIRLFFGGTGPAMQAYPVLWTLEADGSSSFRFSDAFETHPDVVHLIARWLQTLPLLTEFARRTDAGTGALCLPSATPISTKSPCTLSFACRS